MNFVIDPDKLTVGDMILVEEIRDDRRAFTNWAELFSRFMVDDDGNPLEPEEARAVAISMPLVQFREAQRKFTEALNRKAIPPKKGGG